MVSCRDRIWAAVLNEMEVQRSFTAEGIRNAIPNDPPTTRTVRSALNAMVDLGLLESHEGKGSAPRLYYPNKPDDDIQIGGYEPRTSNHRSIFPFPGSKNHIADWIIDKMPAHDLYVEAFGGSGDVIYNKPRSKYEVFNDLSKDIVQFFQVLRDQPEALAEWLSKVPYSREVYSKWVTEYYDGHRPDDEVVRAGRFFSLRYMQFVGISDTPNGFRTRARRSPARTFDRARRRIEEFARRFDQVLIEQKHYKGILTDYDDSSIDVLYYLDPPYPDASYDYGTDFDHESFVNTLMTVDGDWMLSYSEVPDGLSDCTVFSKSSRQKIKGKNGNVDELLICNFDPSNRESF